MLYCALLYYFILYCYTSFYCMFLYYTVRSVLYCYSELYYVILYFDLSWLIQCHNASLLSNKMSLIPCLPITRLRSSPPTTTTTANFSDPLFSYGNSKQLLDLIQYTISSDSFSPHTQFPLSTTLTLTLNPTPTHTPLTTSITYHAHARSRARSLSLIISAALLKRSETLNLLFLAAAL